MITLKDILTDYGDREFLLGLTHQYIMDHCLKYVEDKTDSKWYIQHAKYAHTIHKKLGGSPIEYVKQCQKYKKARNN